MASSAARTGVALQVRSVGVDHDWVLQIGMSVHPMVALSRAVGEPEALERCVHLLGCDLPWIAPHGFDALVTCRHSLTLVKFCGHDITHNITRGGPKVPRNAEQTRPGVLFING